MLHQLGQTEERTENCQVIAVILDMHVCGYAAKMHIAYIFIANDEETAVWFSPFLCVSTNQVKANRPHSFMS